MKSLLKKVLFLFAIIIGVNQSFAQIIIESLTVKDVTCNGGNDGEITIVVRGTSGGTITYNVIGSTIKQVKSKLTTVVVTGLTAGQGYSVTVQESGPTANTTFDISSPKGGKFSYDQLEYCKSNLNPKPIVLNASDAWPGNVVGAFTSSSGLSINPITGEIDLASSLVGNYIITNTIDASLNCGEMKEIQNVKIIEGCGQVTGIENVNLNTKLLYPNPVQNQLNIIGNVKKVVIFNQFKEVLVSELNVINTNQLPLGIYFVKIIYSDNSVSIEKIIKE